jgi:hypothetical protein
MDHGSSHGERGLYFFGCKSWARLCILWAGGHDSCLQACIATELFRYLHTGKERNRGRKGLLKAYFTGFRHSFYYGGYSQERNPSFKLYLCLIRMCHERISRFKKKRHCPLMSTTDDGGAFRSQQRSARLPSSCLIQGPTSNLQFHSVQFIEPHAPLHIPPQKPWPTDPKNPCA